MKTRGRLIVLKHKEGKTLHSVEKTGKNTHTHMHTRLLSSVLTTLIPTQRDEQTYLLPLVSYCLMFLIKWIFFTGRGRGEPDRFRLLRDKTWNTLDLRKSYWASPLRCYVNHWF